jgi:serine/threonine protein kinase
MRRATREFDERLALFLNGDAERYGNPLVKSCIPSATYLKLLGIGGQKLVILVRDSLLGQRRVLNICLPNVTEMAKKRFFRGVKVLSQLTYSEYSDGRIPPFPFVYFLNEFPPFFCTEYVAGKSLRDYILADFNKDERSQLGMRKKLKLFKRIIDGADKMHSSGVVHRDFKPDNILIDLAGSPKIIDFGIAMSLNESQFTRTGAMLGTPNYAAPEQGGEYSDAMDVDNRADIYSLAKVLYFMVVGDECFATEKLPCELVFAITRAWEDEPDRRHESVKEFWADICMSYHDDFEDPVIQTCSTVDGVQAFHDLLGLWGGNSGKIKKMLGLSLEEWRHMILATKRRIVEQRGGFNG